MNERKQQIAFAIVRIVLGVTFFLHGMQKVFGAFGGSGLGAFAKYMSGITSVMPELTAYAVAFGELLSGTALILGCFHRLASISIILIMLGAIYHVHWSNGFFMQDKGFEYNLALIAMATAVLLSGPGAWAYKIEFKKNKKD